MNVKNLFVMRHAHALNIQNNDWDRELSGEGILQATNSAQFLKANYKIDKILCSSAVRTQHTFAIIQQLLNIGSVDNKLDFYEASEKDWLLYVMTQEDSINNLLIIGHNPSLSNLVKTLSENNHSLNEFSGILTPAEIAIIQFESESWKDLMSSQKTLTKIFHSN